MTHFGSDSDLLQNFRTDAARASHPGSALLAEARTAHRRLAELPGEARPDTVETAYLCQAGVVSLLLQHFGGTTIGHKIACTNEVAQRQLHVNHPFSGCLLEKTTYASGVALDADPFFMRVMEAEFGFLMARDLTPIGRERTREEVAAAVEGVLGGLEIVDSRFDSWTTVGTPSLIADNACHAAWVRGDVIRDWREMDLAAQPVRLLINGQVKGEGSGAAVLGHPLNALTWLANALNQRGQTLRAGEYVTTGVTTDIYEAAKGDHIVAEFGPVGTVEARFV